MVSPCRVDSIEESAPLSHADFLFRSVTYTVTRVSDGRTFRLRMPKRPAWRRGEVVSVEDALLESDRP